MKTNNFSWKDWLILMGPVIFFFGCIASSQKSVKTLKTGQVSVGGSFMACTNLDNSDANNINLFDLDFRAGVGSGIDLGLMYTIDISEGHENEYGTIWGDFKAQLTNRENIVGEPILSVGLMKGYIHEAETNVTSIPLWFGVPVSEYVTPSLLYRLEFLSDDFIPHGDNFDNPRHTIALNSEFNLTKPNKNDWITKIGVSLGFFNSLDGGNGDSGLIFNVGISVDSPY
jgi:hypothetical protein